MTRFLCASMLALALASGAYAQEGFKQTDNLIKRADETVKAIGETKAQLEKTLEYENGIMKGGAVDTRKLYNELTKGIADTNKKAEDVRTRVAAMEAEAHTYFQGWADSVAALPSEDLKKRSQERMIATRRGFDAILAAGRRAGAEFTPFMGTLGDQVVYLGFDLNPSAVASLSEDAAKVNAQAKELYTKVDEVTRITTDYIVSLKPE